MEPFFCEGLVDSDYNDFDSKVEIVREKWLKLEEEHGTLPGFCSWFSTNKATVIKITMLKSNRIEAGLGSEPSTFTTNPSETTNAIIKAHVSYKHNQLLHFVNHSKGVIDEQEAEVERAVIRRGKFRFKEEYQYLEVEESEWFRMSTEERQRHLKKVHSTLPGKLNVVSSDITMPVDEAIELLNIPAPCLEGIWQKASMILSSSDNVTSAPGQPMSARMVISSSGKRPHLVSPCQVRYLNVTMIVLILSHWVFVLILWLWLVVKTSCHNL